MRILHLHSSFNPDGKELRSARLINLFGPAVAHTIVSAQPGALDVRGVILPEIPVDFPDDFPSLTGRPTFARLHRLARAMGGYDLVLTYNWGAMDAVMAHTLFARALPLPPLVHHEDGFSEDQAQELRPRRNWYRRIALGRASALVVPSARLEQIAVNIWQQPRERVRRISNGIVTGAYRLKPRGDALPRVIKRPGELWVGTLAGLRGVQNLPRLLRAFAPLPDHWQLVIVGEGPEREAIRDLAIALKIGHRVHLPGSVAQPAEVVGLFDLFALSSDIEQFPIAVVEAMAAGLAVAAPDVGDVAAMVAPENRPYIVAPGSDGALAEALALLAADPALRARLGAANRARAQAEYDEAAMVSAYARLYAEAMGRSQFP